MSEFKKYAIKREDSGVSIATWKAGVNLDKALKNWEKTFNCKAISFREVTEDKIPNDRTFRDAWTDDFDTDSIDVDMEKAQNIHMERIRAVRNNRLEELDREIIIALGKDKSIKAIENKKQKLRDIPQTFDLKKTSTPDELKDMWPKELKELI